MKTILAFAFALTLSLIAGCGARLTADGRGTFAAFPGQPGYPMQTSAYADPRYPAPPSAMYASGGYGYGGYAPMYGGSPASMGTSLDPTARGAVIAQDQAILGTLRTGVPVAPPPGTATVTGSDAGAPYATTQQLDTVVDQVIDLGSDVRALRREARGR